MARGGGGLLFSAFLLIVLLCGVVGEGVYCEFGTGCT